LLLDGKLHLAPIGKSPQVKAPVIYLSDLELTVRQKVLDLGTGTGIWAIDFADQYPSAMVIGTDLSPIQPTWVPPNLKFEIEDFIDEWTFKPDEFDYIHMRSICRCVAD
jgi:cyclopropane fatty-acyl-phospholipid synthase-like methyltransferase